MDKAYDSFRYADRLKSNLMFVIGGVDELSKLDGMELEGGRKTVKRDFDQFWNELNIAGSYLPSGELKSIRDKLMEAERNAMLCNYREAKLNLSKALSHITTLADKYMGAIEEMD